MIGNLFDSVIAEKGSLFLAIHCFLVRGTIPTKAVAFECHSDYKGRISYQYTRRFF